MALRTGGLGVYGGVEYDPVRRTVTLRPNSNEVRPGLQYVLTVTDGVRGWDGSALAGPFAMTLRAGPRQSPPGPRQTPSLAREVGPLLAQRCAAATCHGGPSPSMGLDLSTPEALRRTTLLVPARQRPEGPWVRSAPRWGALPRIDPGVAEGQGRPAMSYLVYKLLGDGPIAGERMPPGPEGLSLEEVDLVARWIAAGAPDN